MKDYIEKAKRTESYDMKALKSRLVKEDTIRLLHAGIGMTTEAGEFIDMMKKHIFYGKELDLVNLQEEIGDLLWYIAVACDTLDTTIEAEMERNIKKLEARYPEKFTKEHAENRNLDKERAILEGKESVTKEHPNGLLENDEAYYHPSWNAKKVLKAYQEIDNASYPNITDIVQIEVDGVLVWAFPKL